MSNAQVQSALEAGVERIKIIPHWRKRFIGGAVQKQIKPFGEPVCDRVVPPPFRNRNNEFRSRQNLFQYLRNPTGRLLPVRRHHTGTASMGQAASPPNAGMLAHTRFQRHGSEIYPGGFAGSFDKGGRSIR